MRHFTINLFCIGMDVSTGYLILAGHPYFAGIAMFFNTIMAFGMYDSSTSFSKSSMPYFAYGPVYMSGMAAIVFLIQYSYPYWAVAKLVSVFLGVGASLISIINNSYSIRFFLGGILIALSGLAAGTYLVTQNHPFWAGSIILMTLLFASFRLGS